VTYAKAFFDLQLTFAERVTGLAGLPLPRVLLEYTNLYIRFGLGRDFDLAHPVWQAYLAGLADAGDARTWTYGFYLSRAGAPTGPPLVATVGCFAYALMTGERLRLHFRNAETDGCSPLGAERQGRRRAELAVLFEHARRTGSRHRLVVGASWLYNLEAYRRLFPPSYVATARVIGRRFQHMPLWGQFLDRHGEVRESQTRLFLQRLAGVSSMSSLDACFPLPVLTVEAPVSAFEEFYGAAAVSGLGLRKAGPADHAFAYRVKQAAFREYVEQAGGWREDEQRRLHDQRFATQEFRVISAAGVDVGILATVVATDCVKVDQLFLLPEHQGRGLGHRCMALVMDEARGLGLPVRLRVLKVNPRAVAFYRRLGFTRTGETDSHDQLEWSP
jgi:GNAT superfamily N-acetyltransferase